MVCYGISGVVNWKPLTYTEDAKMEESVKDSVHLARVYWDGVWFIFFVILDNDWVLGEWRMLYLTFGTKSNILKCASLRSSPVRFLEHAQA